MSTSTTPPGTTGEVGRVALTSSCWTAPCHLTPVQIIPGSPLQDDGGVGSLGEEEDLDVLHLSLIALRSLVVKEKREQGELEGSKVALEMQELLEEAEVAANEEAEAVEIGEDMFDEADETNYDGLF